MEIIFELLMEMFGEIMGSKKAGKVLRMGLMTLTAGFVVVLCIIISISCLKNGGGWLGPIFCWMISAGMIGLWIYLSRVILKGK